MRHLRRLKVRTASYELLDREISVSGALLPADRLMGEYRREFIKRLRKAVQPVEDPDDRSGPTGHLGRGTRARKK